MQMIHSRQSLKEAMFFKEQGLTEEVEVIVQDILKQDPSHAVAVALATELGIDVAAPAAVKEPVASPTVTGRRA